jgi:hypothetical protein
MTRDTSTEVTHADHHEFRLNPFGDFLLKRKCRISCYGLSTFVVYPTRHQVEPSPNPCTEIKKKQNNGK